SQRGKVLYFAGENPEDVRMRWIAMSQRVDFDINGIDVCFVSGVIKLSEVTQRIMKEAEVAGPFDLVVIDTGPAFFEGDEENSNTQQGSHARRMRSLVGLPGGPCVIVNCHPTKNASDENLLPRGGGSFIAEVDGNLTASKDDAIVTVSTQGKFRGPDFAPLSFQLATMTHQDLKDSAGRTIPTVVASYLSD